MNLVVDHVVQLQHVGVANVDRVVVRLTGATVVENGLAVLVQHALAVLTVGVQGREQLLDVRLVATRVVLVPTSTIEHRRGNVQCRLGARTGLAVGVVVVTGGACSRVELAALPTVTRGVPEVTLEELTDVHTARHTKWREDDVDRRTVSQVGHVFFGQNARDNTLVTVTSGELVTFSDLALLGDKDTNELVHTRGELFLTVALNDLDVDDRTELTVRQTHRHVANVVGLVTEDGAQQALFSGRLRLTLRGDLTDEDVARRDLRTDADDAAVVEVGEQVLRQVRNVASDFFLTQLHVTGVTLVGLDVNRRQDVVLHEALGDDDGVFEVVTLPSHVGHEQVLTESQLTL